MFPPPSDRLSRPGVAAGPGSLDLAARRRGGEGRGEGEGEGALEEGGPARTVRPKPARLEIEKDMLTHARTHTHAHTQTHTHIDIQS